MIPFTEENYKYIMESIGLPYRSDLYNNHKEFHVTWENFHQKFKHFPKMNKAFEEVAFKHKVIDLLNEP